MLGMNDYKGLDGDFPNGFIAKTNVAAAPPAHPLGIPPGPWARQLGDFAAS